MHTDAEKWRNTLKKINAIKIARDLRYKYYAEKYGL